MEKRVNNIIDIFSEHGIWCEYELDVKTGLYDSTGAVYLAIPNKKIAISANTGEQYDYAFLEDCDKIAKEHNKQYLYVNTYKIIKYY